MQTNILLAIALIFLVMASLFESLLYPVSIITSIVFAIVGVFWGLAITATPMSFMAMLGIMILIGVIVNIGIVLIAHVIDLRKEGMNRHDAILEAARHRLRPILMTTVVTLLAMLPLAAGDIQIGGDGPVLLPDGARADVRAPVRLGDVAVLRAAVLRLARRPEHLAPARQGSRRRRGAAAAAPRRRDEAGFARQRSRTL